MFFETSTFRHSVVHRLSTSAAGILNMLSAVIVFVKALNDFKRMKKVTEIKTYLEISIKEIVQHQNLFERKLTDQCKDIARRRVELDELERSFIENMLTTNKKQRIEIDFVFENFLIRFQQVFNPCACSQASNFDKARTDSEAGENMKNEMSTFLCALFFRFKSCLFLFIFLTVSVKHEQNSSKKINDDRYSSSEEKSHQNKNLKNDEKLPQHDNTSVDLDDESKVSDSTLSILMSKEKKKNRKKTTASD